MLGECLEKLLFISRGSIFAFAEKIILSSRAFNSIFPVKSREMRSKIHLPLLAFVWYTAGPVPLIPAFAIWPRRQREEVALKEKNTNLSRLRKCG